MRTNESTELGKRETSSPSENRIKQLTLVSGKGGTGKTTLAAAFASLASNAVIADCDVDAADLHLILNPEIDRQEEFYGGKVAEIDSERCTECGTCEEICRFDAIHEFTVDPISCEGCQVCMVACPENAVSMRDNLSGHWFLSRTRYGPMAHAKLGIAEDNSGKLVSAVRQQARLLAEKEGRDLILIDGPPGIGCPVIAAITGVDLVLAITEPTLSGIHDLKRVLGVAGHFTIPSVVCINKFDINLDNTREIETFCQSKGIEIVGKLPYDRRVTQAMVRAQSIVEYPCGDVSHETGRIWQKTVNRLEGGMSQKQTPEGVRV